MGIGAKLLSYMLAAIAGICFIDGLATLVRAKGGG